MESSQPGPDRSWVLDAIGKLKADSDRSADTPLRRFPLPEEWDVHLYLKDESAHPTGSLKHRLARSLLLHGLVNGDIGSGTTLVESSSGSTAVSVAYFARLLGLAFIAVIPSTTSSAKIRLIRDYGGLCHFVDEADEVYEAAERLCQREGLFYLDQFSKASAVTDWRGGDNIASSIFRQMAVEEYPEPSWIVAGAGTGGTSATIGRFCRYAGHRTRLAVVDPEGSAFYKAWKFKSQDLKGACSRIEGIGRPRVEPSFVPSLIDEVIQVPDAASIAAARWLRSRTGIHAGGSTGTNLVGALRLVAQMRARGRAGSIVTIICDSGDRYEDTHYSDEWVREQGFDLEPHIAALDEFMAEGHWPCMEPEEMTMANLNDLREDVRTYTDSVDAQVLRPADQTVLGTADRLRIALRVAAVNGHTGLTGQYAGELDAVAGEGASAAVLDAGRWPELATRIQALLEHSEQVALDPIDSGEQEVQSLLSAGLTAPEIVAATQVVAYVSYRARLLIGLKAIEEAGPSAPPTVPTQHEGRDVVGDLPAPKEIFPAYKWRPWVEAPRSPEKEAGADEKTPSKWSPFYLTLLHDPRVLEERTALYNAIMTGTGALDRADRELAALATSLTTGCEYCASVHGRRQAQLSKDGATAVALAVHGISSVRDPKQNAIVSIAGKMALTPPSMDPSDVNRLRAAGLDDDSVRDLVAVAAMFAWANRLMMTLGEPDK